MSVSQLSITLLLRMQLLQIAQAGRQSLSHTGAYIRDAIVYSCDVRGGAGVQYLSYTSDYKIPNATVPNRTTATYSHSPATCSRGMLLRVVLFLDRTRPFSFR